MDRSRAIPEESLKEIEKLFEKGTSGDHRYRRVALFVTLIVVLGFLFSVLWGLSSIRAAANFGNDLSLFAISYASIAVGILVAGFSIVAAGIDDKSAKILVLIKEPVAESNLLSFLFSIFVSSLLVYFRLFVVSLLSFLFLGENRLLLFEWAPWFEDSVYILIFVTVFLTFLVYHVCYSIFFLRAFIGNLHKALALVTESKVRR